MTQPPCQKPGCSEPAAPGQKFCSREHAPLAIAYGTARPPTNGRQAAPPVPGLLRPGVLARRLGYSEGSIYQWAREGRIPSETRGNFIYLDEEKVRAAMKTPEWRAAHYNPIRRRAGSSKREERA